MKIIKIHALLRIVICPMVLVLYASSMVAMFTTLPSPQRRKKIAEMTMKKATSQSTMLEKRPKENVDATRHRQAMYLAAKIKEEIKEEKEVTLHASEKELAQELNLNELRQRPQQKEVKWVRTINGVQSIPLWQANQVDVLCTAQGTQENPIDVVSAKISSFDVQLLSDAYDALAGGVFNTFCANLAVEEEGVKWDESGTIYSLGKGRLYKLVTVAGALGAKTLSTLLATLLLPKEMQNRIAPEEFIQYVCIYLKEQLLKSRSFKITHEELPFESYLLNFALNQNSSHCLMGGFGGALALVNRKTGEHKDLVGHPQNSRVVFTAFNKKGNRALSSARTGPLRFDIILWDSSSGDLIATLESNGNISSNAISFSPNGDRILAGVGRTLKIWSSIDGSLLDEFEHTKPVAAVSWHPNGRYFAFIVGDGLVIRDIVTRESTKIRLNSGFSERNKVIFSPKTGRKLLVACSGLLKLFEFFIEPTDASRFRCEPLGSTLLGINAIPFYEQLCFSDDEQRISVKRIVPEVDTSRMQVFYSESRNDYMRPMITSGHEIPLQGVFSSDSDWYVFLALSPVKRLSLLFYNAHTGNHIMSFDTGQTGFRFDFANYLSFDHTGKALLVNSGHSLDVYQLFTDKDIQTLQDIKTELTGAQAFLLYQLCLAKQKGAPVDEGFKKEVMQTLYDLPYDVQQMVSKYLIPLHWRSRIASTVSSTVSAGSKALRDWWWGPREE